MIFYLVLSENFKIEINEFNKILMVTISYLICR